MCPSLRNAGKGQTTIILLLRVCSSTVMVVVAMSSDGRVSNSEVSPRLCRGTHRGLTYAAVEKDEASYSARYFICIPPFSKGGQGGFMGVVRRASATKSPSVPLLQRGKAKVQSPWAAHGFMGAFEAL